MWFENKAQSFENTRFGTMSWMIIAQCCLGGIAGAMALSHDNFFMISLIAAVAMGVNTFMISQMSGKWCVGGFYASVVLSSITILYYLIAYGTM